MILRGAQLSDRRRALVPTSPPLDREKVVDKSGADRSSGGKVTSLSASVSLTPEVFSASAGEHRDPLFSFESVVAWLAVQDQDTKNACAAILANEVTGIHEQAKRDGFLAGQELGERAAQQETDRMVTLLQQIALNAQQAFDREERQLQDLCVAIVGEALAKVAGPLLASERAAVGAIREILSRVKEGRELVIRVSRDDIDSIRKLQDHFDDLLGNRKYEFVADARVELGGCIVETKLGSLDGRLEVQLRELYETLRLAKTSSLELA